jgi:hypothetical protein
MQNVNGEFYIMILVFGGAYQGKLDYVLDRFRFDEGDIYRCSVECAELPDRKKLIYELDKWILALLKANVYSEGKVTEFIASLGDSVIICTDISCGVVPAEPIQRAWREAVGRALAAMAHESEEVIRLYCAIPTRIK